MCQLAPQGESLTCLALARALLRVHPDHPLDGAAADGAEAGFIAREHDAVLLRAVISRHPLYMCYLIWNFSYILMFPSLPMIAINLIGIYAQILRL